MNVKKLGLIFLFLFIFLVLFSREKGQYNGPLRPIGAFTGIIQKSYHYFSSGVRGSTGKYFNLLKVKTENELLTKENLVIRAQLGEFAELKKENERLKSLLDFKTNNKSRLLAAKVIGQDLFNEHNFLSLNRGENHGAKNYMAVISTGSVVGYIIETYKYTSKVLLITDKYSSIDSIVQRSRVRGLLEGFQKNTRLNYLNIDDDVQVGDMVVTSGLQNIFPKGFPIGQVTQVDSCLLYTSPSPRDATLSRMPSSA